MRELCSIKSGKSDSQDANEEGEYAFFDRSKKIKRSTRYLYDCEALIIPGEGAEFLPRHFVGKFDLHQRAYALYNFSDRIDVRFLFYFLTYFKDYFEKVAVGATVKSLRLRHFEDLPVAITQLKEQKRIVTILDEAFEAIAMARANAEKNLQNARALFESHLQSIFTQCEGWLKGSLDSFCEVKDGTHDSPQYVSAGIPFVTQKNVRDNGLSLMNTKFISKEDHEKFYKRSNVAHGDILISMIGANRGMACLVDDERVFSIKNVGLVKSNKAINLRFLLYFLKSSQAAEYVRSSSRGGAQEFIGLTALRKFPIAVPELSYQVMLVSKLDQLSTETQRLESICQQKLVALDELKKSLLHQAFSGELSKNLKTAVVIPFPAAIKNIEKIELHAGVLAMMYVLHEKHKREKYVGHVKAEKTAHLVEFLVGIDLGRDAYKDAAGPNDATRLKEVEEQAEKAGYFSFKQVERGRYEFNKLAQFESLIARTRQALGERCADVDHLLELMLPMDKRKAELFATVYAAWNNLLLLQKPAGNEQIVREAREEWHPDKMDIPREEFFAMLGWIRQNNVIPQGRGKLVGPKTDPGELFAGLDS